MVANKWDELVSRDQKRNCVDKSKQSQNDKARQPIGISQREESFDRISQFTRRHGKNVERRTPDVQRRILQMPGGRFELPTKGL